MLGEEHKLTLVDLANVCPNVYRTLSKLRDVVRRKETIEKDCMLQPHKKTQLIEKLDFDSCPISELGLVFKLPGYENIELKRGGSEISVNIHNLHEYIEVMRAASFLFFPDDGFSPKYTVLGDNLCY